MPAHLSTPLLSSEMVRPIEPAEDLKSIIPKMASSLKTLYLGLIELCNDLYSIINSQ